MWIRRGRRGVRPAGLACWGALIVNYFETKISDALVTIFALFGYHFGYFMALVVLWDALELYMGWAAPTPTDLVWYASLLVLLQFMRAIDRETEDSS